MKSFVFARLRIQVPVLAIACVGLLAHGLLLFTDYRLWDGWEYGLWLSDERQKPFLDRLFGEIGRPLDVVFWIPFAGLQSPQVVAKVFGLTAWIVQAVLMYASLQRPWALGHQVAMASAMLVVTCPVFRPLGELSLWMNTCAAMLFWLATYLFVKMAEEPIKLWRMGLRATGLCVLVVALNLNSLLVFFYGMAAVLVLRRALEHGLRRAFNEAVGHALRYPDILLLPVLFWCWKAWVTPTSDAYINYNHPRFDLGMWRQGYLALAKDFLIPFTIEPFTRPGVIAFSAAVATIFGSRIRAWPELGSRHEVGSSPVGPALCGGAGLLLLIAASFPYICVGQSLSDEPWLARNNILTPLPMALLVVAAAVWTTSKLASNRPFVWFGVCLVVCGVWGASAILGYVRLQAFGVKQMAVRAHLRELIQERNPAVIQFRDYVAMRGGIAYYPPLIWTAMAACCDRAPCTLVVDTRIAVSDQQVRGADGTTQIILGTLQFSASDVDRIIEETTTPYALTGIPREGRQYLLAALPSATMANPEQVAVDYLRMRWGAPAKVDEWVKNIIEVKVVELEPIRAVASAR